MPKTKYSGVKWLGNIPEEWKVVRVDYYKDLNSNYPIGDGDHGTVTPEDYINEGIPYIRVQNLSWGNHIITDNIVYISEAVNRKNKKSILKPGDIVIAKTGATIGKIGIIPDKMLEANTTSSVGKVSVDNKYSNKYVFYSLLSDSSYQQMWDKANMKSAQPGFNIEDLIKFKICFPPIKEQHLIADFLDEKVDIIDKIIDDLNNQIEILNKYKKQIITETVTSGLNKNVKFKDSGIDWMGEIPEHWEIKRLKYLGSARNGLTYEPEDQCDEGMLVLRSSNIQDGKLCLDDNVYVNMKVPKNIILKRNDLLICSRNGSRNLIGKNILIEDSIEGNTYGAFMCVFRSEYNKYIHYVLNSNIFEHYLNTFLTSTINQLTNSNLYSIKIAIPMDIEEQQEIVKYLDDRCQKIDEILNSKIKQKKQMEQYKKSVIYEYVTGKKRVEGAEELYE